MQVEPDVFEITAGQQFVDLTLTAVANGDANAHFEGYFGIRYLGSIPVTVENVDATIRADAPIVTEGEMATLTLTIAHPVNQDLTINYRSRAGSAATNDFEPIAGTVVIPEGETSAAIALATKTGTKNFFT